MTTSNTPLNPLWNNAKDGAKAKKGCGGGGAETLPRPSPISLVPSDLGTPPFKSATVQNIRRAQSPQAGIAKKTVVTVVTVPLFSPKLSKLLTCVTVSTL